jgi:hypothetical protein
MRANLKRLAERGIEKRYPFLLNAVQMQHPEYRCCGNKKAVTNQSS